LVKEPGTAGAEDEIAKRDLVQAALDALGRLSDADKETLMATFGEQATDASGATFRKRRERAIHRGMSGCDRPVALLLRLERRFSINRFAYRRAARNPIAATKSPRTHKTKPAGDGRKVDSGISCRHKI
jgi:hypothetical protein